MSDWHTDKIAEMTGLLLAKDNELAQLRSRIAELEGARAKSIGKPSAGFVRDEEWLRETNSEVVGQAVGYTVEAIGYAMAELDRRADVIAAQDAELVRLREWSRRYGADLCPRGYADTFGDGMRAAKEHVSRLLDRAPAQAEPRKRRGPGPDGPPKAGEL